MSKVLIQLSKSQSTTAPGITFASTKIVVTDSAGAVQNFDLNGSEALPWSVTTADLADGAGTVVATDVDTTGAAIGSPVNQSFTAGSGIPPVGTAFPQTSGIVVTAA